MLSTSPHLALICQPIAPLGIHLHSYVCCAFGYLATMCVPWEAIISQAISLQVANQTSEIFIANLLLSTFILIMNESGTFCCFLTGGSLVTGHSEGSI